MLLAVMALSKALLIACLLLFMLRLHHVDSSSIHHHSPAMPTERSLLQASRPPPTVNIDCVGLCAVRCSRSWKAKMCKKLCGGCCNKCNCVPAGTTVAARAACPCYANMRNPRGKLKCP